MDPKAIMDSSRGRRSIDTIKLYDPSKANWECEYRLQKIFRGFTFDGGQT